MAIYQSVDVFFVSKFVGKIAIGSIGIVQPITFLISSAGMAIGMGGASIISRGFGSGQADKVQRTFGNQLMLTLSLSLLAVLLGFVFMEPILKIFGANQELMESSKDYFRILLIGLPALAWAMMSNHAIRAEGKPKVAMLTLVVPAIANIILDPILIYYLGMGIEGAAWATTVGYIASGLYTLWFFQSGKSELRIDRADWRLSMPIVKEIASLGSVTYVRQASFSLLAIVLNNSLDAYGGSLAIAIYGIIRGFTMLMAFPNIGVTQGMMPIIGYNYGAELWPRIKDTLKHSLLVTTAVSSLMFVLLVVFAKELILFFTTDPDLIREAPRAVVITFLGLPTMGASFLAAGYFQAIGKVRPALLLTLARQGMLMIPLMLVLPLFFGLDGVWYSMPIGEFLATVISVIALYRAIRNH